jgi:allantoinase
MISQSKNIIKNVLICREENKLQLCDIVYDSKIIEIRQKSDLFYDWDDLRILERRDQLLNQVLSGDEEKTYLLAIPGAIDSHIHFDTPGFEFREDFEHGSSAAASGGVTTIIDMPCTSLPPVTSKKNFQKKIAALKNRSVVDYLLWGGVNGNDFKNPEQLEQNIFDLTECGVAGFKAYFTSGMETFKALSFEQMKNAADIIRQTNLPLAVHAEDNELVTSRMIQSQKNGMNGWKDYCHSRDVAAEIRAIEDIIKISEEINCKIHIVHLSSKAGLELIGEAQSRGVKITTETCPHYLYFTQNDFENPRIENFLKTTPPVKFKDDMDALWSGLNDGTISFVVTDHAGCDPDKEKSSNNFWEVYGGIPGVEYRVPFLFSEGFLKNRLTLEKTINLLSKNVAEYFNIKNKGVLKPGYDADFSLINLWADKKINSTEMHSKGKYTPFEGVIFNAVVEQTFLRGGKIFDRKCENEFFYDYGKFVKAG